MANKGSFKPGQSGNPKGRPRKLERRDGWINEASGHGTAYDRRLLTRYGVDIVTDLEAIQLWRSEWLCARVIETRPREAFRRGYELKLDDKEIAEKVVAKAEELGVDAALVKAGQYRRAYGGAAIFPVLDGALGDLSEPLDETRIADVKALHVLEPRQLQPVSYYTDLSHPKFGQPEIWRFMPLVASRAAGAWGQLIHESRLVIFPGTRVSVQTQPGQREGWGDSELSKPYAAIRDYGLSWGSATTILHNFGRDVLQFDGWAELAAQADGGEEIMAKRMRAFEIANSTLRVGVIDAKDRFTPRGGSLAGLSDVLIQQAQYVAAATEHPVTVLMGMSPAGLNATGDMDVRNWYATIENDQATEYKPRVEQIYRLLLLASAGPTRGKEPKAWSVEFRPLLTPSEKEQAETRKIVAETDKIYFDIGAASPEDIATSRWKGDTYSPEMVIDWKAREEQAKLDEERAADLDDAALEAMGRVARTEEQPTERPEVA
jgi:phage-related protein (TIGR01555 family)